MTIPQVRKQRIQPGTILVNRRAVRLDAALEDAREGVLAMLGLGEANPGEAGVMIQFRMNAALEPEQYTITTGRKDVIVEAGGIPGAVYAASTIAQRCAAHDDTLSYGEIEDAPTYPWRGLLVDVCRHFFPMQTLKTIVDLLAYYKYNRLHLHLSEDQGFRFESERFPLLNSVGSYRKSTFVKHADFKGQDGVPHGGYYTKAELRELVRYAKARGIEIVPEIDMPGHALSMIAAYPDLACVSEPVEVATRFGVTDFSKKLFCAGSEKTFELLFSLLDEVMEIFPFPYLHIGGDEALKSEWKRCERCQHVMREQGLKDERELQGYFLNRVIGHLALHGREAIVWNDGLCDGLDPRAIVQHWTPWFLEGPGRTIRRVNAGGRAILSPYLHLYYDYPYAMTPLKKTFGYRPTLRGVRKKSQDSYLGVEAAIWTEWIDTEEKLFFNTLPRLAATAETGWAAREKPYYDRFTLELEPHYRLYERLGLTYAKHAEKPLSLFQRIRGVLTFAKDETHAELLEQNKE
ncbi:MAG: beta-N-acetylhexosaminidase [Clostridiaceae bacterium]